MNYEKAIEVLEARKTCALCEQDTEDCFYCEEVESYQWAALAAAYDLALSSLMIQRELAETTVEVMELEGLEETEETTNEEG